jgi:hypothetical protein
MDYASLLGSLGGGGGGGGGGYSGELKNDLKTGGDQKATFGTVNFGAGAKVGGTSTAEGDAGTGQNQILIYVGLGLVALLTVVVLLKK